MFTGWLGCRWGAIVERLTPLANLNTVVEAGRVKIVVGKQSGEGRFSHIKLTEVWWLC